MHPHQVISLEDLPGETSFALPDHYDHVHIGYHPLEAGPFDAAVQRAAETGAVAAPDQPPRRDRKPRSADRALEVLAAGRAATAGQRRRRLGARRRLAGENPASDPALRIRAVRLRRHAAAGRRPLPGPRRRASERERAGARDARRAAAAAAAPAARRARPTPSAEPAAAAADPGHRGPRLRALRRTRRRRRAGWTRR